MNIKDLEIYLDKIEAPKFRLKQTIKAIYQDNVSSFSDITTIAKDLRADLDKNLDILSFTIKEVLASNKRLSFKALLKLPDDNLIETVLLKSNENSWTACISSQAGCALNCKFCATGQSGFKRNLYHYEISDQILFWKQYMKQENLSGELTNIVYMGMGEPFMNYDEVKKSLNKLMDKDLFGFGARSISVSTAGLPEGIKKFTTDFPQVNLAISIISADDELRAELMPISERYGLNAIKKALDYYFKTNNRKVFLEYIMLKDINDKEEDAEALISFVKSNLKPELLHVNLIRYNTAVMDYEPTDRGQVVAFKEYLNSNKVHATIRKSLGSEIMAACGQLAGTHNVERITHNA